MRLFINSLLVLSVVVSVAAFNFNNPSNFRRRCGTGLVSDITVSALPEKHQVYVGNLPHEFDEDTLTMLVKEKAGSSFHSIRLMKDKITGKSRGSAYIDYIEKSAADAAIEALSGVQVQDRTVKVKAAEPRENKPKFEKTPQENSCFIGNLEFSVTQDDIFQLCNSKLGNGVATRVRLATDRETGRLKGFGHVDFSTPEEAQRAISVLTGAQLMGRELRIDHAKRREDGVEGAEPRRAFGSGGSADGAAGGRKFASRDHSVFLGNLAWDVTEDLLKEMLDDVVGKGTYSTVRLAVDRESGRPKGYAHVDFNDAQSAGRAVAELNNLEVLNRQIRADLAQRKESSSPAGGSFGSGGGSRYSNNNSNSRGNVMDSGSYGAF